MYVMPYLAKYAQCIQKSVVVRDYYIIQKWLVYSYELSCQPKLSNAFLQKIANFLSTICVVLTPCMIQVLLPRFIVTVPDLKPSSVVALQYMSAHFSHFNRYYSLSGGWDVYGSATEDEKLLVAVMLYRLSMALCGAVTNNTIDSKLSKHAVDCMQALVDSISPECLLPRTDLLMEIYETKWTKYRPSPCDVSDIKMDANMTSFVKLFVEHQHDSWVHNKMADGWLYGKTFDDYAKKDPKMVRFNDLPQEDRERYLIQATRTIKVLSVMGWKVMQQKIHSVILDRKDPLICYWPRARSIDSISYVPTPIDLTNVCLDRKNHIIAEKLSVEDHDYNNVNEANSTMDSVFTPYDLLCENEKEKKREYFFDFLKVMKACNYELSKMRTTSFDLPKSKSQSLTVFGAELISYVLKELANIKGSMKRLVAVYCPLIHSFLCHYHDYFLPDHSHRNTSNNSLRHEEVLVVQIFCAMFVACKDHLEEVVLRKSLEDECITTKGNVKALLDCITKICAVLNPRVMSNYKQSHYANDLKCLCGFLENAGRSLSDLVDNIQCLTTVKFEYGFKILIPSLSMFFQHFGSHKFGHCIMFDDVLFEHCKNIFFNLVKLSKSISPLHHAAS